MDEQETLQKWIHRRHPRHVASLKRQAATHERAVQRRAKAAPTRRTRKQLQEQKQLEARIAKKKARHAKYQQKAARARWGNRK